VNKEEDRCPRHRPSRGMSESRGSRRCAGAGGGSVPGG
jgi:hypothetical protein